MRRGTTWGAGSVRADGRAETLGKRGNGETERGRASSQAAAVELSRHH